MARPLLPRGGGSSKGAEPREPPEEAAAGPGLPGGFVELLELARGAHDSQVALLSREVQRLRFELAAARAGVWLPQGRGKPPLEASGGAGPEGAPTAAAGAEGAAQAVCVGPEGDEARKDYQAWRRAEAKADDAQALAGAAPGGSEETGRRTSKKSQFSDSFSPPANRPRWDEELPSAIERLVRHKWFEALVIAMICLNVLMMAVEVEHTGLDLREQARQRTSGAPGVEVWPHAQEVFKGLQWVFGLFFTAEIILRIWALRSGFLLELWNWIDLTLVILWACSLALSFTNPHFVRLARLARLARPVRLIRFMHLRKIDSLYLIVTALESGAIVLCWTFVVMLSIHILLALLIHGILHETYFEVSKFDEQTLVFEYYGTFSRAFFTMFEITLANWPTSCRLLIEEVSELFIIYALLHKMILGFAVIGVVNAVFVQETFKSASADDVVMIAQSSRKAEVHARKMRHLFSEADVNGDGHVTIEEWKDICEDPFVKVWLGAQGIELGDAEQLFHLLDNGSGRLTSEEVIKGTARLKGTAATMVIMEHIQKISEEVQTMERQSALHGAAETKLSLIS